MYIGNTSNPVINRIGVVQPWAHNYVPSKNLKAKIRWVKSALKALGDYISYGVNFQSNIFIHEYWYKKHKQVRTLPVRTYMQYYKRFYYSNNTLSIEHSFLIRKQTKEFFCFRPWVLLYNNWFIIIICWYKPPKPYKKLKSSLSNSTLKKKSKVTRKVRELIYYGSEANKYIF